MLSEYSKPKINHENFINTLIHKYLPFWPYFVGLLIVFFGIAFIYLRLTLPVYEVTAKLVIKDEKKGVDDSKMIQSINPFESKKIVENEIQVIQSREVIDSVAYNLSLCAPIYEKGLLRSNLAYTTSPIKIKIKNINELGMVVGNTNKHEITLENNNQQVIVDGKKYSLNSWNKFPYGTLMFQINDKQQTKPEHSLYFEIVNSQVEAASILSNLKVSATDKLSSVVNIIYRDQSRLRGEDVVNSLITEYNKNGLEANNELAKSTLNFIEKRILNVGKELNNLQVEIQKYQSNEDAVDLGEQSKLYLKDAGENNRKIDDITLQLALLNKVKLYVTSKNNQAGLVPATSGVQDPVLSQLLTKLYDQEIEYTRLKKTTAENNPLLLSISDEIDKIRPSILENINNQQSNLRASLQNLNSNSGKFNSALKSIPKKERGLLEIKQREATKNALFTYLLQKREETELTYAPTLGDSQVIEKARATLYPVSPKPLVIYAVAFILSLALGIIAVTGKEIISDKILYRSDIEKSTEIPVLGEISFAKTEKSEIFVESKDYMVIEQFRQLNSKLGLYSRTSNKKNILITSSISGEGKSYVSSNLAYSLGSLGKKVVLVDLDLRKPNTTMLFDLKEKQGVIQFLNSEALTSEIIYKNEGNPNLVVIPAGTLGGDYTSLLLNGKIEDLFSELKDQFDYVIVDSPPIDVTSDAILFAEYSDITLLVMRHGYTPKVIVSRAEQAENVKILEKAQIIFNGIKPRGFVEGNGYGYGYA